VFVFQNREKKGDTEEGFPLLAPEGGSIMEARPSLFLVEELVCSWLQHLGNDEGSFPGRSELVASSVVLS
jgi:hypothetical protein